MKNIAFALLLFACVPLAAQTEKPKPKYEVSKIYEFKNADIFRATEVRDLVSMLSPGATLRLISGLKTVVVSSWEEAEVDHTIELLKHYDVAVPIAPQIEFTAFLLRGSRASTTATAPVEPALPIPPLLTGAITEMKQTFNYTAYGLLDTIITAARGSASMDGVLPIPHNPPYLYSISYESLSLSDGDKTVTIRPFQFHVRIPMVVQVKVPTAGGTAERTTEFSTVGIKSDVAIREGQKLVLGKIELRPDSPDDLFLVLTAKVR